MFTTPATRSAMAAVSAAIPSGATAAYAELGDLDADEARLVWVPNDALMIASAGQSREGRRWRISNPGYTPGKKSPHRR